MRFPAVQFIGQFAILAYLNPKDGFFPPLTGEASIWCAQERRPA